MKPHPNLHRFILPYSPEIQALTLYLRSFLTNLIPQANELIYDNYNAVALAYTKSEKLKDAFCHIAVYPKHVNFGFNRGSELEVDNLQLSGAGKHIRHLSVKSMNQFPENQIAPLIYQAVKLSERSNSELIDKTAEGISLVASVSANKRRPQ